MNTTKSFAFLSLLISLNAWADQFCAGKRIGAACAVEAFSGEETYSGRCAMSEDRRWVPAPAGSGKKYDLLARPTIQYQPENPVEKTFTRSSPSWW